MVSVMKPGVSRTMPATRMMKASMRSSAGICPCCRLCCTRSMVAMPSMRASQAPVTPVSSTSAMVGRTPMWLPHGYEQVELGQGDQGESQKEFDEHGTASG